jgi:hypothetical protein
LRATVLWLLALALAWALMLGIQWLGWRMQLPPMGR